jgi:hypothetical protein
MRQRVTLFKALFYTILTMEGRMTIEQIVEIPADHRVLFEFFAPKEIPPGPARIELKVTPVPARQDKPVPDTSKNLPAPEGSATPITDSLVGILSHVGDNRL